MDFKLYANETHLILQMGAVALHELHLLLAMDFPPLVLWHAILCEVLGTALNVFMTIMVNMVKDYADGQACFTSFMFTQSADFMV
jgi:hypothetical protein